METSPKEILNEWAKNRKNKFVMDRMFTFEKYDNGNHPFYGYGFAYFLHINISHFSDDDKEELSKKGDIYYNLGNKIVTWFMEIVDDLYDKNFPQYSKESLVGLKLNNNVIKFYGNKHGKWVSVESKEEYYNL